MQKEQLKQILTKANSLEKGGNLAMAQEFLDITTKVDTVVEKADKIAKIIDKCLLEVKEDIIKNMPEATIVPEFPKEMSVSNLPEVQKVEITNLPKEKEQKAPVVNIEAPVVNVEAPIINIDTEVIEERIGNTNDLLKEIAEKVERDEIEKVTLVDKDGKPIDFKFGNKIIGGGGGMSKYITNVAGDIINPATEDTLATLPNVLNEEALWLLRRMVKLMESQATVDANNRQRVIADQANIYSPYTATGYNYPYATTTPPTVVNSALYVLPTFETPVDQRYRVAEDSHISYQIGIRSNLSFN